MVSVLKCQCISVQRCKWFQQGVVFFEPRSLDPTIALFLSSLSIKLETVERLQTYLFGDTSDDRSSIVAHIIQTVLPDYNRTFWRSVVGRSRRFEHSAVFTSELYAHPWTPISLIEVLLARNFDYSHSPPDITHLKNTCLGPTGEPDLTVISILAHQLQRRFRERGEVEDLDEAIFYYRHIIEEHDTAKQSFQQAQKASAGSFIDSTSFWIYPTVLLGLSAALHIRLQIQKRRSDYQLLLDCLEKQKELDVLLPNRDTNEGSIIEVGRFIFSQCNKLYNVLVQNCFFIERTSYTIKTSPWSESAFKVAQRSGKDL